MDKTDPFHWAGKVARSDIRRLYESDARGLLDEELLEQVMYAIHARVQDMFEVREAQQHGRVKCRACGAPVPQAYRMGSGSKSQALACTQCGWQVTCGEFYASYAGKDLLPGSRADLFQEFLARCASLHTPQSKMLLLDWLIHAFHVHAGVSGRLVAMNVIQGSRAQLIELLSALAAAENQATSSSPAVRETWLAEENNPIRRFRQKYKSHARVLEVAAGLGIRGRSSMPESELIREILRLAPELGDEEG